MSTIQDQVYKKIVSKLSREKFVSLVKSADILCGIMDKLGLLNAEECEEQAEVPSPEAIQLILGTARDIFNGKDTYEFFFRMGQKSPLVKVVLELEDSFTSYKLKSSQAFDTPIFDVQDYELKVYKFHNAKGPPQPLGGRGGP